MKNDRLKKRGMTCGMWRYKRIFGRVVDQRNELHYPGHKVIKGLGFSDGYHDCNGVAIIGPENIGLSHYSLSEVPPEKYIPDLLRKMGVANTGNGLIAVVVGGDPGHFAQITTVFQDRKIPIVADYQDEKLSGGGYAGKFVAVDSDSRGVIVWSREKGRRTLIPFSNE